ncbi:histidinol-phosphate transaminase [Amylibacter marinus]|nr:histidinol-phosphate transaminase [Amylibacter marinus]
MTTKITPQPGILDIELYVGGKAPAQGVANSVKLSSNENPHGPSKAAREAYRAQADFLAVYPSSDHGALRAAIADVHDIPAENIICGNGSDEIISFLCNAYAGIGDEVLFTEHGFAMYRICAQIAGATPVEVPENNRVTDVDALIAGITENTKIIFVANPNNPTGTFVDSSELARLAAAIPQQCLLVLDSAYAEYVEGYDGGASLVTAFDNVVMTRTFSKVYGLGGLRVGWAYAPQAVIDVLARMRGPFNVNVAALAAAEAAISDREYLDKCLIENKKWSNYLVTELNALGIQCDPTFANFVLARFASEEEANAAERALAENGLIIRKVGSYNLPQCLRITVGKGVDCQRIISVLRQFQEARA